MDEMLCLEEVEFQRTVKELDLKGILLLMETLQTAMYEEQNQFETLKSELQRYSDRNSFNHRKISACLCTSQRRLTNLCTKHMMCCVQKSSMTSEEEEPMSFDSLQNRGFKENLRFFQSQVEKSDLQKTSHAKPREMEWKEQTKISSDRILKNARTFVQHKSFDKSIDSNPAKKVSCQNSVLLTQREHVLMSEKPIIKETSFKLDPLLPATLKSSLLNNFNPVFENNKSSQNTSRDSSSPQSSPLFQSKNASDIGFQNIQKSETFWKTQSNLENVPDQAMLVLDDPVKATFSPPTQVVWKQAFIQVNNKCDASKKFLGNLETSAKTTSALLSEKKENQNLEQSEKYFHSEYDSNDFVVHKTNLSDNYIEEITDENNSLVHNDYVVEDPIISTIDSPREEDNQVIDNSYDYTNDPRRYFYYPEDKELEAIPEEDEDIDDDDYMLEQPYQLRISDNPFHRLLNEGCDFGLTDDRRNSGELKDPPDINMFQNVEYHKANNNVIPTVVEKTKEVFLKDGIQPRNITNTWNPKKLLELLYQVDVPTEETGKNQLHFINKEGYLEKLPCGRRKATYWNPWKAKYFRLKNGFLFCFENPTAEKACFSLQLMGGHVETLEDKMIGVDDQKGHYLVLRCIHGEELESWLRALHTQCTQDFVNAYTTPCHKPLPTNKNIVIIDLGSCSIRAGVLMSTPSLPQLFFPTVCATNKISHKNIFGIDAFHPETRKESYLTFPLHPSAKVTKYSIDMSLLPDLLRYVFEKLNVHPEDYKVQLSMPRTLSPDTKLKIASILLDDFQVKALHLTHQAILSLHAYNSKSGVIVDIGDRLDIIPIIEGYIVESGVSRLPYGGQRMIHHLKHALTEKNISLMSPVESFVARYVLEQLCYVAEDYNEELQSYEAQREDFEMSISTSHFLTDPTPWDELVLDMGRFHVPEGLFTPHIWGLDHPGLHKLVYEAIQECGLDLRKEMTKSIYVSGGLTLLPGFVERLELEIDKLSPNNITSKVHASPYRYHMSYLGACQIAFEEKFDAICITKRMWRKEGKSCVQKWPT